MNRIFRSAPFTPVYDNSLDAFVPELWAAESLAVLWQNLTMPYLVHTDFKDEVASFGDLVNTRRPAKFKSKRKVTGDDVTTQDATATNVEVRMDLWNHISFILGDRDVSLSMKDLVSTYLAPALEAFAQAIDQMLLGQRYDFIQNDEVAGKLGLDATIATLTQTGKILSKQLCPMTGRNLMVSPDTSAILQEISTFHEANKVGDGGQALREGELGRKFGLQIYESQNLPLIDYADVTATTTTANTAAGAVVVPVTSSSDMVEGLWLTVAGDMRPHMITGISTLNITVTPALTYGTSSSAVVTTYKAGTIDNTSDYANNWPKDIVVQAFSESLQKGQMFTTGVTTGTMQKYGAVESVSSPSTTLVTPNRGLTAIALDNSVVGAGPAGDYNFAFHRNAITLVSRPLALPPADMGANSAVVNYKGIAIRVTISYDPVAQATRVTVDNLSGVKTLDTNLGCLMLG